MSEPDYWRRVGEIFESALAVSAGERQAWLDKACAGNDQLRKEVESLLRNDAGPSATIAGVVGDAAVRLFEEDGAPDAMAGVNLGNYRVIRELGRGGMGAVYLASRADQTFDKEVAIKLVKRGIDTDTVLDRFRYERRILAALDHPYIARLLDGGTSSDGRPYFVMEYIDGRPLDAHARAQNLPIAQCCELIAKVCEAVSYAHRNLVIHRDLKPGNILVTADGTPKLLDFGIARLLSADAREQTLTGPQGPRPLTPEFASPEQLRGDAATTATDVYSLGKTLAAILPEGRELPAELGTIIGKATREEIDQRYGSVADLREDLRRYLAGLPILAREQTLLYQAGKFVRRHRMGVAAFVLANLLAITGIAAIIWESRRAERERRQAEQRLSQAVDMAERTLAEVNNSMANLPGATDARRQIVHNTLDYVDRLAKDSGGDARVLTALAMAYVRVAEVLGNPEYANLGDISGSLSTYRKSVALIQDLLKKNPGDLKVRDLAEVAHQGEARVLQREGKAEDAEAEYRAAIAVADGTLASTPDRAESQVRSLEAHYAFESLRYVVHPQETEEDARKQLPIAQKLAETHPADPAKQDLLSEYEAMVGTALSQQNREREALAYFHKALDLREEICRRNPRNAQFQENLMMGYGHMGDALGSPFFGGLGDYRGAVEYYMKAERIAEDLHRADPSDARAAFDMGMVWTRIGAAQRAAGELKSSNGSLDRAIGIFELLWKSTVGNAAFNGGIMLAYNTRGQNMADLGDTGSATNWYRKTLAITDKLIAEGRGDATVRMMRVGALEKMANALAASGDRAGAVKTAEVALKEAESNATRGGSKTSLAQSWYYYARTQESLGDCKASMAAFARAVELYRKAGAATGLTADHLREAQQKSAKCGTHT